MLEKTSDAQGKVAALAADLSGRSNLAETVAGPFDHRVDRQRVGRCAGSHLDHPSADHDDDVWIGGNGQKNGQVPKFTAGGQV